MPQEKRPGSLALRILNGWLAKPSAERRLGQRKSNSSEMGLNYT